MDRGMSFFAMPLLCSDICPENRDESNLPLIDRGWLPFGPEPFGPELKAEGLKAEGHFIPIFRTMQSHLLKGA
jgi:hypothetical protein